MAPDYLLLDRSTAKNAAFFSWTAVGMALVLLAALGLQSMQQTGWAAALAIAAVLGFPVAFLVRQLAVQQARLAATEQRAQVLLHSTLGAGQGGSWWLDLARLDAGLVLSEQAQQVYGYRPGPRLPLAEWLRHANPDAGSPTSLASVADKLNQLIGDDGRFDCTYLHRRSSDGRMVWLHDRGLLRRDASGQPAELVGMVLDVTETRQAQEESYRNATALQQAMDSTLSGTWSVDYLAAPESMCISERAQHILGLPAAPGNLYSLQEIRQHRTAANHPECLTATLRAYEAVHKGESDLFSVVSPWRRPDTGAVIWTHTTGKVRRDSSARLVNLIGMMRDVTQEKAYEMGLLQAKLAAEDAARAKGDFLANMSHEILTPLNAILGLSAIALKGGMPPAQQEHLEKISHAGKHLLGVLNDVLDFSKLESGELQIETLPFSVQALVDSVIHGVAEKADRKGLELVCSVDPFVPSTLLGDALRIAQVVGYFADNAVKFTDAGHIHLSVSMRPDKPGFVALRLTVADTGIGMTQAQCSRLFVGFMQADSSVTRRFGGIGMGLAICKKLTEAMGGSVGVESVFGSGSTFFVDLPLAVSGAGNLLWTPNIKLHGKRALVVDDSPLALSVLSDTLVEAGLDVQRCENADQAVQSLQLAHAEQRPWDAVLLDYALPGVADWSVLRTLRAAGADLAAVVLMAAAHRCKALEPHAQLLGIRHVLAKPVLRTALLHTVVHMVDKEAPAPAAAHDLDTALQTQLQALRGARLLLVEDNEINQQFACDLLMDAGFAVDVADNGQVGLDMVQARFAEDLPYDLVLMDIQMPVMDGIAATLALRKLFAADALPIVAVSANTTALDRERSLQAGMNDFIAKPLEPARLWRALVQHIKPRPDFAPVAAPVAHPAMPQADTSLLIESLRLVEGLDVQRGLMLTNHKPVFYVNMLRKFASAQATAIGHIRAALEQGDAALAERTAHTLKGLAATLGATPLHHSAGVLETHLRAQAKTHLLDDAIELAQTELNGLLNALHGIAGLIVAPGSGAGTALTESERHTGSEVLQRIMELLRHYNADALDLWQNHAHLLHALVPDAHAIEAAINDFNFDEALRKITHAEPASADAAGAGRTA